MREIEANDWHKEQKIAQLKNVKRKRIYMKMKEGACLPINRDLVASVLIGETADQKWI